MMRKEKEEFNVIRLESGKEKIKMNGYGFISKN